MADYWIHGTDIAKESIDEIKKLDYVDDAQGSMSLIVESEGKNEKTDIRLTTFDNNTKTVLNPVCMDGEKLEEDLEGILF